MRGVGANISARRRAGDQLHAGFIAQEYAEVFPADVVSTRDQVPGAAPNDPNIQLELAQVDTGLRGAFVDVRGHIATLQCLAQLEPQKAARRVTRDAVVEMIDQALHHLTGFGLSIFMPQN